MAGPAAGDGVPTQVAPGVTSPPGRLHRALAAGQQSPRTLLRMQQTHDVSHPCPHCNRYTCRCAEEAERGDALPPVPPARRRGVAVDGCQGGQRT